MRALIPHFINEQFRKENFAGEFEALTLHVDITGFTTLTEKLMLYGKEGVEQLSSELNLIFDPLVRSVYAQGGFIATFAGDAFTALFPVSTVTKADVEKVSQCALSIHRFFLGHTTLTTIYGTFEISAKISLGIGQVEWCIIGEGKRFTYLFRGTAIDSCLVAQKATSGKYIGIAPDLVKVLSSVAEMTTGQQQQELRSLKQEVPERVVDLPILKRADLEPFVLDAVVDFQEQAEFRNVATVFMSIEWIDPQASQLFIKDVLALASQYGGYFNKLDYSEKGTVVLVVFGAPITYANDLVRAANFVQALKQSTSNVRWRAGITYGTAYAGFLGGSKRSEYTVIGDAVNLSARQMDAAAWNEVWVSANVADTLRQSGYSLDTIGEMLFKGKQNPLTIYRLNNPIQQPIQFVQNRVDLVGRRTELVLLRGWLDPLLNNRFAGVITIYGEAGMGKSYLVSEFKVRTPQFSWYYCPTDEILQQSLNPFRFFLRRYFDQSEARSLQENQLHFDSILNNLIASLPVSDTVELGSELERLRPVLAALVNIRIEGSLYEQLEPKLRFDNMLVAIKTLFLSESLRKPVIVHIEDAHWLDIDSLQLIKTLTRNVAKYPIVILMTSRYQDDGKLYEYDFDFDVIQHNLDLIPLLLRDIKLLAEHKLEAPIDDAFAAILASKASGNPLFIEQLVLDLRERRALVQNANGMWTILKQEIPQVPSSISAVLVARLDRLVADVRSVVYTATVLGHEFEVRLLSAMLRNDSDLLPKVQRAEREAIWSRLDEIRYIFRHALLRDTAYDMQLRSRLRELHRLAADAIEQLYVSDLELHYADLAYHANRARDTKREIHYSKLAGQQAAARFANAEAIKYFSRVLDLVPESDPLSRFEILLSRERVYDILGARVEQNKDLDSLQSLAEQLDNNDKRAEVLLRSAIHAEITGDYKATVIAGEKITSLTESPQLKSSGYLYWGLGLVRQAEYEPGGKLLDRALEVAQGNNLPQIEADARRSLGIIAVNIGDFNKAQMYFELAQKSYEAAGNRRSVNNIMNNLGTIGFSTGNYPSALSYMQQAAKGYLDTGDRFGESVVNNNLGAIFGLLRNYAAALSLTERSLYVSYEIGNRRSVLHSLANLITFAVTLGDFERADTMYSEAVQLAEELNDREKLIYIMGSKILGEYYQGKLDQAYQEAQNGLKITQEIKSPPLSGLMHILKGHLEFALNKIDEAEVSYGEAMRLNIEIGETHLAVEPLAGLARVALARGNHDKALQEVNKVLEHLNTESLDGTNEPIQLYLTSYRVLHGLNDPRANKILETAHTYLQETVLKIPDERRRQMFLNNIPHHRELMQLWQASSLGNSTL